MTRATLTGPGWERRPLPRGLSMLDDGGEPGGVTSGRNRRVALALAAALAALYALAIVGVIVLN